MVKAAIELLDIMLALLRAAIAGKTPVTGDFQ